jgi:hypothetical protein
MITLSALLLPILLSAVFVFIASSIIHMTPLWHRSDFPRAPQEDQIVAALRPLALPPGDYMVPKAAGMADMRTQEFKDKLAKGPVLVMTVMPNGPFSMNRNLVLWFVFVLVVSVFVAYVAGRALPAGTPYLRVFQVAGTVAFMGYAFALWELAIWFRRSLSITLKATLDGLIYAGITAGTFGWLWPH